MSNLSFALPPTEVWDLLPGGSVALNDRFGEVWQFMGTLDESEHQFRHRAHPTDGSRHYVHISVATPHRILLHSVIWKGERIVLEVA